MGREEEIVKERLKKLNQLKEQGIEPYPYRYDVKDFAAGLQNEHSKLKKGEKSKKTAKMAGRLIGFRDIGKIAFGVLKDSSGKMQLVLQKGETPEKLREFFKRYIDSGDF